jgi:hypothetical protein
MGRTGRCERWLAAKVSVLLRFSGYGSRITCNPHRVEHFKFSADPEFVHKVRDIVGLYLNPPEKALVLSVDEKSQIQALDREVYLGLCEEPCVAF